MTHLLRDIQRAAILVAVGALAGWIWNPQSWRSPERPPSRAASPVLHFKSPVLGLEEAKDLFAEGRLVIIDARQRVAYEQGHVPGAIAAWTSGARSLLADVRRWLPAPDSDVRVVVIGADARGFDSRRLAGRLRMTAAVQPQVLEGGMAAWVEAGLPVVRGWDMAPLLGEDR